MMPTNKPAMPGQETPEAPSAAMPRTSVRSRRGFIGAAAGGVGVFLTVQARTALGQVSCQSISAEISGNLSAQPAPLTCAGGNSPTVWKLQSSISTWPAGVVRPTFKHALTDSATACPNGKSISDLKSEIQDPGTLASDVLVGADAGTGIWEILAAPGNFANGELMSHLLAAWLNAMAFPGYPIPKGQIGDIWLAVKGGGRYCPANLTCTATFGMTASDVITFITNTYVKTNTTDLIVCKA